VTKTSELKMKDYASSNSDRTSLSKIDGEKFTVTAVQRYDYEEDLGVLLTTRETFTVDGQPYDSFYTTRMAVVAKFLIDGRNGPGAKGEFTKLSQDINAGNALGPVKVVSKVSEKSKRSYFDLEDA
jgi:hypothetical protein